MELLITCVPLCDSSLAMKFLTLFSKMLFFTMPTVMNADGIIVASTMAMMMRCAFLPVSSERNCLRWNFMSRTPM